MARAKRPFLKIQLNRPYWLGIITRIAENHSEIHGVTTKNGQVPEKTQELPDYGL